MYRFRRGQVLFLQNYTTGIVAPKTFLCYDDTDREGHIEGKERNGMSKHVQFGRSNTMYILPWERQDLLCVRPKQAKWISADRSFR